MHLVQKCSILLAVAIFLTGCNAHSGGIVFSVNDKEYKTSDAALEASKTFRLKKVDAVKIRSRLTNSPVTLIFLNLEEMKKCCMAMTTPDLEYYSRKNYEQGVQSISASLRKSNLFGQVNVDFLPDGPTTFPPNEYTIWEKKHGRGQTKWYLMTPNANTKVLIPFTYNDHPNEQTLNAWISSVESTLKDNQ